MGTITVIDNEKMSLWFHEESKIIHHKIKNVLNTKEFEDLLSKGADYIEKYKAKKWLSDDRDNIVISQEANEWGDKVWAPRVIKAGFSYWAVVVPIKAMGKLQMSMFIKEYKKRGVTVEIFDDVDHAIKWLENC
ncbi:MAG TPA: hypothetical protein PK771_08935 [Spirochaetota bacterium]|nr:hypothetical protein [Spirochaetota bacterium]